MENVRVAARPVSVPLIVAAVLFAGLAVLVESQLHLNLKMPGHRALPGAVVLTALAFTAPRALFVGFALLVGALIALLTGNPLLIGVWLLPALLLATLRPASTAARIGLAVAAGLAFGLLRYLALPDVVHHTPTLVRLGGHLAFGALGAVGIAFAPRAPAVGSPAGA